MCHSGSITVESYASDCCGMIYPITVIECSTHCHTMTVMPTLHINHGIRGTVCKFCTFIMVNAPVIQTGRRTF